MSQQQPQRFRPYSTSGDETSPDAKTRRIDSTAEEPWQDMVNPEWRGTRKRATSSSRLGMPDQQRLSRWLDRGGWKYLVAAAVVVIIIFIVVLATGSSGSDPTTTALNPQPDNSNSGPALGELTTPGPLETVDPNAGQPTAPVESQPVESTPRFAVTGTGVEGLFLRDAPDVNSNILKTMPEGTIVEKIGEQQGPDRMWFNIRDTASNLTGWAAADYLQPAPQQ